MSTSKVGIAMADLLYKETLEMILKRQAIMFAKAHEACETIWAENVERMDGPAAERPKYMVRVQERAVGITIAWMRCESQYSHKARKYVPRFVTVRRGKTFKHFPEHFRRATGAELDRIMEVERKVGPLRKESDWNIKMKRLIDAQPVRVERNRAAMAEKRAAAERSRWQADRDDEEQMLGL